jgi:hypothetical protein
MDEEVWGDVKEEERTQKVALRTKTRWSFMFEAAFSQAVIASQNNQDIWGKIVRSKRL